MSMIEILVVAILLTPIVAALRGAAFSPDAFAIVYFAGFNFLDSPKENLLRVADLTPLGQIGNDTFHVFAGAAILFCAWYLYVYFTCFFLAVFRKAWLVIISSVLCAGSFYICYFALGMGSTFRGHESLLTDILKLICCITISALLGFFALILRLGRARAWGFTIYGLVKPGESITQEDADGVAETENDEPLTQYRAPTYKGTR